MKKPVEIPGCCRAKYPKTVKPKRAASVEIRSQFATKLLYKAV
jgi:hypothetical protein